MKPYVLKLFLISFGLISLILLFGAYLSVARQTVDGVVRSDDWVVSDESDMRAAAAQTVEDAHEGDDDDHDHNSPAHYRAGKHHEDPDDPVMRNMLLRAAKQRNKKLANNARAFVSRKLLALEDDFDMARDDSDDADEDNLRAEQTETQLDDEHFGRRRDDDGNVAAPSVVVDSSLRRFADKLSEKDLQRKKARQLRTYERKARIKQREFQASLKENNENVVTSKDMIEQAVAVISNDKDFDEQVPLNHADEPDVVLLAKQLYERGLIDRKAATQGLEEIDEEDGEWRLELQDPLTSRNFVSGENEKKEKSGVFEEGGWRAATREAQTVIELSSAFGPKDTGAIEVDITDFDPPQQFVASSSGDAGEKHHMLALYSRGDGTRTGWNDDSKAWLACRVGREYVDKSGEAGMKLLAAARGTKSLSEVRYESRRWPLNSTFTLRLEFSPNAARVLIDGVAWQGVAGQTSAAAQQLARDMALMIDDVSVLSNGETHGAATAFARRVESLTHVFLGKDNQAPGFGGALYSNLRVWRRRVDVLSSDDGAADDDDDADDSDDNPLLALPRADDPLGIPLAALGRLSKRDLLERLDQMAPHDPSAFGRAHFMVETGNMPGKFGTKYPILRRDKVDEKLSDTLKTLEGVERKLAALADGSATAKSARVEQALREWHESLLLQRKQLERAQLQAELEKQQQQQDKFEQQQQQQQTTKKPKKKKPKKQTQNSIIIDNFSNAPISNDDVAWYKDGSAMKSTRFVGKSDLLDSQEALPPPPPPPGGALRVVGINVADGLGLYNETKRDTRQRIESIVEWLQEQRADVIVMWNLGADGVGCRHLLDDVPEGDADDDAWSPSDVRALALLWDHKHAKKFSGQSGLDIAVTSNHNIHQLVKIGRSIAYGAPDGKRFRTPATKFANAAYALEIQITDQNQNKTLPMIVTSMSTHNGAQRYSEAQGILDSFYEVFQHTSTPVLLIGAFEALSRADTHHYVELGTIEALRDALVLEKNAVINTDMGLLYDTMDLLSTTFIDICGDRRSNPINPLAHTLPTSVRDANIPLRFGPLRLDYAMLDARFADDLDRIVKRCVVVRDAITWQLSPRFPIQIDLQL